MGFSFRQIKMIEGALNNMLDKMKATVRQGKELRDVHTAFQWFQQLSPIPLIANTPPLNGSDKAQLHFEAIFFFNGIRLYVDQTHEFTEFRGHPYLEVLNNHNFLGDLNPEEYYDKILIDHIEEKFGLQLT